MDFPLPLHHEVQAILIDYLTRIDRLGADRFRMCGESRDMWETKQIYVRQVLARLIVDERQPPPLSPAESQDLDRLLAEIAREEADGARVADNVEITLDSVPRHRGRHS